MNKDEGQVVDKCVKKLSQLQGDLLKNPLTGAHEIWIKKSDMIKLLNEMVKELRGK